MTYLKRIKVQNFKSFSDFDIELDRFNVIIGSNAAGKSNFVQVFNFLRDVHEEGLDNAFSLQGGIEYIHNFKENYNKNLIIELEIKLTTPSEIQFPPKIQQSQELYYSTAKWRFRLKFMKNMSYKIIEDRWKFDITAYDKRDNKKFNEVLEVIRKDDKTEYKLPHKVDIKIERFFQTFPEPRHKNYPLIKSSYYMRYIFPEIYEFFNNLMIYDFDPKLAKKPVPLKGKLELESDGSNLAILLKHIINNKEDERKFSNLVTDLLPFVESVDTKSFADKSMLFTLKETYFKNKSLPSFLISDGTINVTALIIALYFQHHTLTIIEEPERGIHPHLVSTVMEMMNDASPNKQILVTTHNPEVIRHVHPTNILSVKRNENGYSKITKIANDEEIKMFLTDELEINELYVQNILN